MEVNPEHFLMTVLVLQYKRNVNIFCQSKKMKNAKDRKVSLPKVYQVSS